MSTFAVFPKLPSVFQRIDVLLFLSLWVFAFGVRIIGIENADIQADEHHWQSRSHEIISRLKAGKYDKASTHLGQPGVPPALAMAGGQIVAHFWNELRGKKRWDRGHIDHLEASRLTNAFVSSLVIPVMYFGVRMWLGGGVALFASLLFALDPHHLSLSRQAHLDSMLTLFVTLSLFFYLYGLFRGGLGAKIFAGLFWGLSIATKPTAALLVLSFLFYKLVRSGKLRKAGILREGIVSFGDIWAVVAGHIVFGLLYTRLWHHNGDYLSRLRINSVFADSIYSSGLWLGAYPFSLIGCVFALGVVFALIRRAVVVNDSNVGRSADHLSSVVKNLFALIIFLLLFLRFFPQVMENQIRFWAWAFGLNSERHVAYGRVWEPPPGGYLVMYASELPTLVVVGVFLGLGLLIWKVFRGKWTSSSVERECLLLLVILISLWTAVLSVSPKQTLRYVMPVIPGVYLLASWGLLGFAEILVGSILPSKFRIAGRVLVVKSRMFRFLFSVLCVFAQAVVLLDCYPDYAFFRNSLFEVFPKEFRSRRIMGRAGADDALLFLHEFSKKQGKKLKIALLADRDILAYDYRRRFRPKERRLKLLAGFNPLIHEFVVVEGRFLSDPRVSDLKRLGGVPIFFHIVDGIPITSVYMIPLAELKSPRHIRVDDAARETGKVYYSIGTEVLKEKMPGAIKAIVAKAGADRRGYLLFGKGVRVAAGEYYSRFFLGLPRGLSQVIGDPEDAVLRLEMGSKCQRIIERRELSDAEVRPVELDCSYSREVEVSLRAYFYGKSSVMISALEFGRR